MVDYNLFSEMECIKRMEENDIFSFKKILEHYGDMLSNRIVLDGSAFTSHGINHCLALYRIISNVILRENTPYHKDDGLTRRELYILNLAVLFHDISMSVMIDVNRGNHSVQSSKYVQNEYDAHNSVLKTCSTLTPNECRVLRNVIKAHSDIKGDSAISRDENGLNIPDLNKTYKDVIGKEIRGLFIAGVLRLADELDVTNDRLGNSTFEYEIKKLRDEIENNMREGNIEAKKQWASFLESEKHWERLHLFESVELNDSKNKICLVVDDEYAKQKRNAGESYAAISKDILDVHSKVNKEFIFIKQKAFSESDVSIYVYNIDTPIDIVTTIEELNEIINKAQSRMDIDEKDEKKEEESNVNYENTACEQGFCAKVVDKDLEVEITEEIKNRQLLEFGHFLLNDKYCARDWINVRELVETMKISKKMVNSIIKHINTRGVENVIILGMDMVGSLLASRVAFLLQCPMSYCVSPKNSAYNASDELNVEIKDDYKVIIITESIVTFLTMQETIEKYRLNDKIDSIYTVFFRKPNSDNQECQSIPYPVYSLNNDFPIEIVEKANCCYKEGECYAKNRH